MNLDKFEEQLGLNFKNKVLLKTAFTHRSYLNENRKAVSEHNERLEFLGDAVLELVITDLLFKKYPEKAEGEMTSYRAALVNAVTLAGIAEKLEINNYLLLSKGEAKDTGRARQFILANAIEAIIGAIYLDQGYDIAKNFIEKYIWILVDEIVEKSAWLDAKSHFQERAQEIAGITPSYEVVKEAGPDHDKRFTVGVFLGKEKVAEGEGQSKQDAEQDAAKKGLEAKKWG